MDENSNFELDKRDHGNGAKHHQNTDRVSKGLLHTPALLFLLARDMQIRAQAI